MTGTPRPARPRDQPRLHRALRPGGRCRTAELGGRHQWRPHRLGQRLFMPALWDTPEATARRRACRIPTSEHHRPKWRLALEILDELAGIGLRPAVLVADAGYGANADFRHGLEERGLGYVLQTKGEMTAYAEAAEPHQPSYGGLGPRPLPRYRTRPLSLREHVMTAGRHQGRSLTWRKGSKAAMSSHFVLLRIRLAGRRPKPAADGTIPLTWLIAQWPEGEEEPVKYWISNLPADLPAKDLVRLAKSRWRIEHDYRELKTALGLDHFEGRCFAGWHRHVTLVTAAHLFLTEHRRSPKAPARA
ncbi:IS701 family transposase [Streptomyces sp. NPDC101150]|uniref:IS701 family transposase n=1 Tax=Streptomyces sp. NPDC101150 TaxID=3366114 RepID=UPI0038115DC8